MAGYYMTVKMIPFYITIHKEVGKIINRLGIKITSQNKYCLLFSEASKHSKQMSLDRGMCAREDSDGEP